MFPAHVLQMEEEEERRQEEERLAFLAERAAMGQSAAPSEAGTAETAEISEDEDDGMVTIMKPVPFVHLCCLYQLAHSIHSGLRRGDEKSRGRGRTETGGGTAGVAC